MDMEFLLLQLIKFMELAETIKSHKTGKEKKEWVIERINQLLIGASEDVKELVPDILIKVDKHEIAINPVVKSSCFKFMKCLNLS
jgi:hypothetical protein